MTDVVAPLALEAWAVGGRRVGIGARVAPRGEGPLVIAGVAGALDPALRPGDLVVASDVRADGDAIPCATDLAEPLGARVGPIASVVRVAGRADKRRLAATGAIAIDMESYWLVDSAGDRPVAVVRAIVDPADRRLADPRTITAGIRALLALRRVSGVLKAWAPVESHREEVSR